jgi:LacI family transcriptional regulator
MKRQRVFRIGVADSRLIKAGRDRTSGIMRYAASRSDWEVRWIVTPERAESANEMTARAQLDGIIGGIRRVAKVLAEIDHPIPAVIFDRKTDPAAFIRIRGCVNIDDAAIGETGAAQFIKSGSRQLAFVGVSNVSERPYQDERLAAFRRTALSAGIPCEAFVPPQRKIEADDIVELAAWLARLPHPCGVMAYSDNRAQTVLDACRLARLRVPEQIQLVGVDNEIEICENMQPTLTSILPDFEMGGFLAAKLLDDILSHRIRTRKPVQLTYGVKDIIVRASTQDLKGSGRLVTLAREFIRLHAHERITVADIATHLNVARRTIENRFGEVLGRGVADILREERLKRVARLLRETNRTISDIAYDSGFASPTHLAAAFKRFAGMTMGEFRSST